MRKPVLHPDSALNSEFYLPKNIQHRSEIFREFGDNRDLMAHEIIRLRELVAGPGELTPEISVYCILQDHIARALGRTYTIHILRLETVSENGTAAVEWEPGERRHVPAGYWFRDRDEADKVCADMEAKARKQKARA